MRRPLVVLARCAAAALIAALAVGCASPSPASSSAALTRGVVGPLSFTYPTGWTITPVDHLKHYETVLAFLTSSTASASESCGPDYMPGMGSGCTDSYALPAGGVVIRFSTLDLPTPYNEGAVRLIAMDVAGGLAARTVAGQPAAFDPSYTDGEAPTTGSTEAWFIAGPGKGNATQYVVVATVNAGDAAAEAAVQAIVDSLEIASSTP
jgi:hypothetical protein